MTYTITQGGSKGQFVLRDSEGHLIALVLGEDNANIFAHVPELLEFLDAFAREDERLCHSDGVDLKEKLKPFRP